MSGSDTLTNRQAYIDSLVLNEADQRKADALARSLISEGFLFFKHGLHAGQSAVGVMDAEGAHLPNEDVKQEHPDTSLMNIRSLLDGKDEKPPFLMHFNESLGLYADIEHNALRYDDSWVEVTNSSAESEEDVDEADSVDDVPLQKAPWEMYLLFQATAWTLSSALKVAETCLDDDGKLQPWVQAALLKAHQHYYPNMVSCPKFIAELQTVEAARAWVSALNWRSKSYLRARTNLFGDPHVTIQMMGTRVPPVWDGLSPSDIQSFFKRFMDEVPDAQKLQEILSPQAESGIVTEGDDSNYLQWRAGVIAEIRKLNDAQRQPDPYNEQPSRVHEILRNSGLLSWWQVIQEDAAAVEVRDNLLAIAHHFSASPKHESEVLPLVNFLGSIYVLDTPDMPNILQLVNYALFGAAHGWDVPDSTEVNARLHMLIDYLKQARNSVAIPGLVYLIDRLSQRCQLAETVFAELIQFAADENHFDKLMQAYDDRSLGSQLEAFIGMISKHASGVVETARFRDYLTKYITSVLRTLSEKDAEDFVRWYMREKGPGQELARVLNTEALQEGSPFVTRYAGMDVNAYTYTASKVLSKLDREIRVQLSRRHKSKGNPLFGAFIAIHQERKRSSKYNAEKAPANAQLNMFNIKANTFWLGDPASAPRNLVRRGSSPHLDIKSVVNYDSNALEEDLLKVTIVSSDAFRQHLKKLNRGEPISREATRMLGDRDKLFHHYGLAQMVAPMPPVDALEQHQVADLSLMIARSIQALLSSFFDESGKLTEEALSALASSFQASGLDEMRVDTVMAHYQENPAIFLHMLLHEVHSYYQSVLVLRGGEHDQKIARNVTLLWENIVTMFIGDASAANRPPLDVKMTERLATFVKNVSYSHKLVGKKMAGFKMPDIGHLLGILESPSDDARMAASVNALREMGLCDLYHRATGEQDNVLRLNLLVIADQVEQGTHAPAVLKAFSQLAIRFRDNDLGLISRMSVVAVKLMSAGQSVRSTRNDQYLSADEADGICALLEQGDPGMLQLILAAKADGSGMAEYLEPLAGDKYHGALSTGLTKIANQIDADHLDMVDQAVTLSAMCQLPQILQDTLQEKIALFTRDVMSLIQEIIQADVLSCSLGACKQHLDLLQNPAVPRLFSEAGAPLLEETLRKLKAHQASILKRELKSTLICSQFAKQRVNTLYERDPGTGRQIDRAAADYNGELERVLDGNHDPANYEGVTHGFFAPFRDIAYASTDAPEDGFEKAVMQNISYVLDHMLHMMETVLDERGCLKPWVKDAYLEARNDFVQPLGKVQGFETYIRGSKFPKKVISALASRQYEVQKVLMHKQSHTAYSQLNNLYSSIHGRVRNFIIQRPLDDIWQVRADILDFQARVRDEASLESLVDLAKNGSGDGSRCFWVELIGSMQFDVLRLGAEGQVADTAPRRDNDDKQEALISSARDNPKLLANLLSLLHAVEHFKPEVVARATDEIRVRAGSAQKKLAVLTKMHGSGMSQADILLASQVYAYEVVGYCARDTEAWDQSAQQEALKTTSPPINSFAFANHLMNENQAASENQSKQGKRPRSQSAPPDLDLNPS